MQQNGAGSGGGVEAAAGGAFVLVMLVVELAVIVLMIASLWRVFTKAGQPGWAAIIPFLNLYIMCKIAGKPGWWLILMLIPCVGIIFNIIVTHGISQNFGRGVGTTLGLIFLPFIFYPILAWGDAQYQGPATPGI